MKNGLFLAVCLIGFSMNVFARPDGVEKDYTPKVAPSEAVPSNQELFLDAIRRNDLKTVKHLRSEPGVTFDDIEVFYAALDSVDNLYTCNVEAQRKNPGLCESTKFIVKRSQMLPYLRQKIKSRLLYDLLRKKFEFGTESYCDQINQLLRRPRALGTLMVYDHLSDDFTYSVSFVRRDIDWVLHGSYCRFEDEIDFSDKKEALEQARDFQEEVRLLEIEADKEKERSESAQRLAREKTQRDAAAAIVHGGTERARLNGVGVFLQQSFEDSQDRTRRSRDKAVRESYRDDVSIALPNANGERGQTQQPCRENGKKCPGEL